MLNKIVTSSLAPLTGRLAVLFDQNGVTASHIRMARIGTGIVAILLFGLQYMGAAVAVFMLHKLIEALNQKDGANDAPASRYLVAATALLAVTWTATNHGLPVAFLFWSVLVNIITEAQQSKSALRIADSGELSLICIILALAPDYLPAIAILGGVVFTISSAWNSLGVLRSLMSKI